MQKQHDIRVDDSTYKMIEGINQENDFEISDMVKEIVESYFYNAVNLGQWSHMQYKWIPELNVVEWCNDIFHDWKILGDADSLFDAVVLVLDLNTDPDEYKDDVATAMYLFWKAKKCLFEA